MYSAGDWVSSLFAVRAIWTRRVYTLSCTSRGRPVPELVGEVLDLVHQLVEEESLTALVVTHEMLFAIEVGHRVLS